jgi:hypothetical protein
LLYRDESAELAVTPREHDAICASTELAADFIRRKSSYDSVDIDHGGSIAMPSMADPEVVDLTARVHCRARSSDFGSSIAP